MNCNIKMTSAVLVQQAHHERYFLLSEPWSKGARRSANGLPVAIHVLQLTIIVRKRRGLREPNVPALREVSNYDYRTRK